MLTKLANRQRWIAPEVIQTSAMDCGPASLTCLLRGLGVRVSYGRLREACQTDVDGTSIDRLEEVAAELGLQAEQVMVPPDHLLLRKADLLPALLIVTLPGNLLHFLVVWRQWGPWVQVMDPACGRRWFSRRALLDRVYRHALPVPAEAWREWAGSDEFLRPLAARLEATAGRAATRLAATAVTDSSWRGLARLDAATRMTSALRRAGAVNANQARRLVNQLADDPTIEIPDDYWSVKSVPSEPHDDGSTEEDAEETVVLRGAVLVRVSGVASARKAVAIDGEETASPELAAALNERAPRPARDLLAVLWRDGWLSMLAIMVGTLIAAGGLVLELLLLRGLLDIGLQLPVFEQRLGALLAVLVLALTVTWFACRVADGRLRLGRVLEARLRMALLRKIPRLHDRYLQSRPVSDMAARAHAVHLLRDVPMLAGEIFQVVITIGLTAAAISWVYSHARWPALLAAVAAVGLPWLFQGRLSEQDFRTRSQSGALSRFYLDSLLGSSAIQAHSAERVMRREHESLLVQWFDSAAAAVGLMAAQQAMLLTVGFALAAWTLATHLSAVHEATGGLLLAYWALQLPLLGGRLGQLLAQYPQYRSTLLRLVEPLGAPEQSVQRSEAMRTDLAEAVRRGTAIEFQQVRVVAAGQEILRQVDLRIPAGQHVAVVGPSGAGKSTLVALLLGWHRPAAGHVYCDGELLDQAMLQRLRPDIAWVDPSVQLWNRTLLENLRYGHEGWGNGQGMGDVVKASDLFSLLEKLPDGMDSPIGESGGLLSGGEGQRVRLGRAIGRFARLVILDEPFRGLERDRRSKLTDEARRQWCDATLLLVSHDIENTLKFDRVLVVDEGCVVEDGRPDVLAEQPESHYRRLLEAERDAQREVWGHPLWRRLHLRAGQLVTG